MNKEKVMEYQILEQQMQALTQNLQNIENNLEEINKIITTLNDFKTLKKGDNILVPVANGIFAEATLQDSKNLKVNVGSNVVVKKDVEGAKKIMDEQIKDLEKYREETMEYYNTMYAKMQTLQQELVKEQESKEKKS